VATDVFLKKEIDLLAEAPALSVEQLVEKYFGSNPLWRDFLYQITIGLGSERRSLIIDIAYDVQDSTEAVHLKRPDWSPKIILPETEFRKDLNFEEIDYGMLHGALKIQYIPYGISEFSKLKKVSDCVDYVLENRLLG